MIFGTSQLIIFTQSKALKLIDLVEFPTAAFMFKARNNVLPCTIQERFCERDLRGMSNFKTPSQIVE